MIIVETFFLFPVILTCFFLLTPVCSKLTRESGTDFPIPMGPAVSESETEKLIREKDEEVQHANHEQESHHDQEHEAPHNSEHSEPDQEKH